ARPRGARSVEDETVGEDERLERSPCLRPDRPRPAAEDRLDVRQGAGGGARVAAAAADDVGIPQGETAERTRPRRLQPESMGKHAREHLLRAADAAGD